MKLRRLYALLALVAVLFASCGEAVIETPQPEPTKPHLSVDMRVSSLWVLRVAM